MKKPTTVFMVRLDNGNFEALYHDQKLALQRAISVGGYTEECFVLQELPSWVEEHITRHSADG